MTELITAPADRPDAVEHSVHVIESASQQPVIITEQEVAFSTAAAVPKPRSKPTRRMLAALRRMLVRSSEDARPLRRHCPPRRDAFLERAAMTREMRRL